MKSEGYKYFLRKNAIEILTPHSTFFKKYSNFYYKKIII